MVCYTISEDIWFTLKVGENKDKNILKNLQYID